ncbi:GNAT family N-acetyltransferase [Pararhizobium antarcticum]|uniref:Ribosomal-protein-alanine acetyltransferase n=1 Tax=Pararhizobium antarcticum TaxID=1798805 RepID=A0A657LKI0_9HYPH|nr:N-acetyltransferase [Pararhizobium antarcticum]OJF90508.1 ribosomal-protein-alanine acetyltransferase [Pararhizobium antarcticum]OJF98584.1 ribosomal-protein-alanine acetyltransferase [Rhizobium sp. 58]
MALTDYFVRKPEFDMFAMKTADLPFAASIHKACFTPSWSDGELHALLVQNTVFGFVARQSNAASRPVTAGFVLSRVAAGEAEILTIGVEQRYGRAGLGWRLMQAAVREARAQSAEMMFLEVDEANAAALGLYRKLGFHKVGERRAYYQGVDGARSAALVMRLDLV